MKCRTVSHQLLVAVMALKAATWMQPSVCGWRAASSPRDPLFLCLPCASATHPMVSGAPRHRVIHSCWHGGNCQKRLPARRAAGCCTVARGTQWRLVMRSMPRCHATSLAASLAGSLPACPCCTGCLTGWLPGCAHARGIKATAAVGAVLRPSVVSTGAECCAATAVAAAKLRLSADEGCLCSYVSPAAQPRGVRTLSDGNTGPSVLRAPGSALSFTIILRCHQASRTFDYQRRVSVERSTRSVDGIEGP